MTREGRNLWQAGVGGLQADGEAWTLKTGPNLECLPLAPLRREGPEGRPEWNLPDITLCP